MQIIPNNLKYFIITESPADKLPWTVFVPGQGHVGTRLCCHKVPDKV